MKYQNVVNELNNELKALFPNAFIKVNYSNNIISECIKISVALGKDTTEWENGIIQNDSFHNIIHIFIKGDIFEVKPKLVITNLKPLDKYSYCRSFIKKGIRTIKTDSESVLIEKLIKVFSYYKDEMNFLLSNNEFIKESDKILIERNN